MTVKQRVVIIPGDQPEEGINSHGGKDFEKRKVLRQEWKMPRERSISGPGSEYDDGEQLDHLTIIVCLMHYSSTSKQLMWMLFSLIC